MPDFRRSSSVRRTGSGGASLNEVSHKPCASVFLLIDPALLADRFSASSIPRVPLMRGVVCFLALCLAAETAFAQSVASPNTTTLPPPSAKSLPSPEEKSPERIAEIKERVAFWLKTCLEDWDAQTHMTRKEWRTTCERVAAERGTFLLTNTDSFSMESRQRRGR